SPPVGGKVPASIAEFGRLVTDQSGSADRGSSRTTLVVAGSVQVPSASPSSRGPSRAEGKQISRSGAKNGGRARFRCRLLAARAPLRLLPPHPSHPIMRRPHADLEEKRDPRVASHQPECKKGDSMRSSGRAGH